MQDHAVACAKQINAVFAIILAVVDPCDREWIAERLDGLMEGATMRAPVGGRLGIVPFESVFVNNVLITSSFANYSPLGVILTMCRVRAQRKSRAAILISSALCGAGL